MIPVHRISGRIIVHVDFTEPRGPQGHEPLEFLVEVEHGERVPKKSHLQEPQVNSIGHADPFESVRAHLNENALVHRNQLRLTRLHRIQFVAGALPFIEGAVDLAGYPIFLLINVR